MSLLAFPLTNLTMSPASGSEIIIDGVMHPRFPDLPDGLPGSSSAPSLRNPGSPFPPAGGRKADARI